MKETLILSNRDQAFLKVAIAVAQTSGCNAKHGSVLVKAGRILSVSTNKFRNIPRNLSDDHVINNATYHAEKLCLRMAGEKAARGASIYVARVTRLGNRLSRPCTECYEMLLDYGIKSVVYTEDPR